MKSRGKQDDFFQKYFSSWGDHPEHAPDCLNLLRIIIPIDKADGTPGITAIAHLDAEARTRGQRMLFALEDAAKDFYEFYDKFLTEPLARDLERGAEGNKLRMYFEWAEHTRVPDLRVHGAEKVERATQEIAPELLAWLRAITPEKILDDIKRTLDQHYDKGLATASPGFCSIYWT